MLEGYVCQVEAPGVSRRACNGCTLCCKLVPVAELRKKAGERCQHQRQSVGCAIYPARPHSCRGWSCAWIYHPRDTEAMHRPDRVHYVVDVMVDVIRFQVAQDAPVKEMEVIQVWVDPAFPDAWRDPALLGYLEAVADKLGYAALIRNNNVSGFAVFAPAVNPFPESAGCWVVSSPEAPNTGFGRYASLPPNERPPL